ncbi:MAG: S8 family serine peptidase, partial [bacterium]|nr:S8 family serine peptidase [bacterium]
MKKTLVIVTMLLLAAFVLSAEELKPRVKHQKGNSMVTQEVHHKLIGPLADAAKIYRKQQRIKSSIAVTTGLSKSTIKLLERKGKSPILHEMLVDPKVQKRWKNPSYDVLTCLLKHSGSLDELKKFNLKVRSVSGKGTNKVVSVEMASTELEKVAALASVTSVTPIPKKQLASDQAALVTGIAPLRLKEGDEFTKGYTGKGVIFGVIDTGIDLTHEDFLNADGGTRILYLWDPLTETPGKTPAELFGGALAGFDYGTVWTKAEIDAGQCTAVDDYGHGTHVTGVGAGNGRETGQFAGMAPNTDIIMVKEDYTNNGVLFIYELATRLGKPCIANMSYTAYFAIHMTSMYPDMYPADGTSPAAQQIEGWNQAYGPGHIPVKSAGNYGHWNSYTKGSEFPYKSGSYHAQGQLSDAATHTLDVPDYGAAWAAVGWSLSADDIATVQIGMWYESPLQVSFISPSGHVVGPVVHGTSGTASNPETAEGAVNYVLDNPAAANGHYYATLTLGDFLGTRYYPEPGQWQVVVEPLGAGTGKYDMWCADIEWYYGDWYPVENNVHPLVKFTDGSHSNYILDESASSAVITVGGWVSQNEWQTVGGGTETYPEGYILGAITNHSGPGPARNGVVKPDVAAPSTVMASLCQYYWFWAGNLIHVDGKHAILSGTSTSTPVVSGGIALILEKYPNSSL